MKLHLLLILIQFIKIMRKKAKLYRPSKTAMQSGTRKYNKWVLEYITDDPGRNPLMGWESSTDTYTELKLEFKSREVAINYAKRNNIEYELIEPKNRKLFKKTYADNFIK